MTAYLEVLDALKDLYSDASGDINALQIDRDHARNALDDAEGDLQKALNARDQVSRVISFLQNPDAEVILSTYGND